MKIVFLHGRQPFTPKDPFVEQYLAELRAAGNEVDYVWLPPGTTDIERKDAAIAAALLYIEGTDRLIAYKFPAEYVTPIPGSRHRIEVLTAADIATEFTGAGDLK